MGDTQHQPSSPLENTGKTKRTESNWKSFWGKKTISRIVMSFPSQKDLDLNPGSASSTMRRRSVPPRHRAIMRTGNYIHKVR